MSEPIDPRSLALFVRFVRMNPKLAEDDPLIARTFAAYVDLDEPTKDLIVVGWHR